MNPASPATSGSTSLRPRNRRNLIDGDHLDPASATRPELTPSANLSSRPSSPTAPRSSLAARSRSTGATYLGGHQDPRSASTSGFWGGSLTALKDIASDLWGGATTRGASPSPNATLGSARRAYGHGTSGDRAGHNAPWGPTEIGNKALGSGTQERQRAELEAKRREKLLIAQAYIHPDGQGRYKRRGSNEREHMSMPPSGNSDRDTLIYVHKVMKGDTMAGILIKYNSDPGIFRRTNRLWPHDSIQSRTIVVLPVESCGVKGRKISEADMTAMRVNGQDSSTDIVDFSSPSSTATQTQNALGRYGPPHAVSTPASPSVSASLSATDESSYEHDSWVLISGFAAPTEVGRLPRRALGYFPRTRRKSQTLSNPDTPSPSFDLPRSNFQSEAFTHSSSRTISHFGDLRGPGGVGSMDRNVRSPGPANDGLNKLFPGMERRVALYENSATSDVSVLQSNGLENLGGSIETWVRKLANKASTSMHSPHLTGSSGGDLIELSEDVFESTTESVEGSDERGRSPPADSDFGPRGKIFLDASKRRT